MHIRKISCSLLAVSLLGIFSTAESQGLASLETDEMKLLYFDPSATYLSPHVARCFHSSLAKLRSILDFDTEEQATIFLKDFSDYGNAAALSVPRNMILFDIAPMSFAFEKFPTSERTCTLMNHEMVHVVSIDQATKGDKRARGFFGGKVMAVDDHPETILYSYLTNPRNASAYWYLEGIAVFMETWLGGGWGRAQSGYYEMVFRSMVRDDAHFYDPLGLESEGSKVDFQLGVNNYLYGSRFVSYLAYQYSPETLIAWIRRQEGSKGNYVDDFEHVFGLPLNQAWQEWIVFEHEFQNRNLETARQFPITPHKDISSRGLGSVSRSFYDPGSREFYVGLRYPGVVAHLGAMSIDDGATRKLIDIKGPMLYNVTSLAFDPEGETLFYTTDANAYRDVMSISTDGGKPKMLLKNARIGDLVFNKADRSLWGVRHLNGLVTLVRIPHPYNEWEQVHTFEYGELIYNLDISPDGQLLSTSFGELSGDQSLRVFGIADLLNGDVTPLKQFDFGQAVPESFVFSPDGRYLFGSSYYTGISNIFRYELATEDLEAVSNAESGFFRPVPLDDGSLMVLRYTGEGFLPTIIDPVPVEDVSAIRFLGYEIVRKHPQLKDWQAQSPADIPLDDLITHEGEYSGIANLSRESIYPIVEGYKDEVAIGINASFSDAILLDTIDLSVSHNVTGDLPSDEDLHATLEWRHIVARATPLAGSWTVTLRHNPADFYDLFGPTKQGLKGQSGSIKYEKTLVYDKPREMRLEVDLSHYTNLDRLPRYQNVPTTFDELSTFGASLEYEHLRRSLGAVDDEKGFRWHLGTSASYVDGDVIPKVGAEFDFGFALPWKHSSIWFRSAAGGAFGDPDDEFANFFFGGFGNNYVDRGSVKRYREYHAMPGFELNEIPGRNFYRGMIEWNLPPIRFRRVGTPSFYLTWARPALFGSHLVTNLDDAAIRQEVNSAGLQIDFRFTILSRLDMTLSLGYAKGFGSDPILDDDEFMASLKIL
jgi:hypothetical protein